MSKDFKNNQLRLHDVMVGWVDFNVEGWDDNKIVLSVSGSNKRLNPFMIYNRLTFYRGDNEKVKVAYPYDRADEFIVNCWSHNDNGNPWPSESDIASYDKIKELVNDMIESDYVDSLLCSKEHDGTPEGSKPLRYSSRTVHGMDVIDLVKHWGLNFNEGNILKYLLRDKGEDESDLEKIIDYAQRELNHKKSNKKSNKNG